MAELEDDHFHDHCGLFGIFGHSEAANLTYLGLHALQHRGQESAGIVTSDGEKLHVEKGMGLVIPGFIPSPLGEIVEYRPTWMELSVTAGVWALGFFVLTVLVRVALPIELGEVRSPYIAPPPPPIVRPRATRRRHDDMQPVRTR